MKKFILTLTLAVLGLGAMAQYTIEPDFSSVCPTGQVLHYKVVDYGEVQVWPYFQYPEMLGGHIQVPRTVKHEGQTYVVTGIADSAFANCIRIQGVELPNTLFTIGNFAFDSCTDLHLIDMPKTLTSIGEYAFEDCVSLVDVVMPHSVVELGAFAFIGCCNVRHFVISHALTEIPEGCFYGCSSVTDYMIPANITTIGCYAFAGYRALKNVTFLGSVPPMPVCDDQLTFSRDIPIRVTKRAFDAYKKSYIWGQYPIQAM